MDLSSLNEMQKEAVTTSSQFSRVIAGAGSGKTRVLTYRIAYLIENNLASPLGIIGVTFTNKAAREIKERVMSLCPNASMMRLSTIHSLCARFLRSECEHVGYKKNFTILDDQDCLSIMKDIFTLKGKAKDDPNIKLCLNWISSKKNEGLHSYDLLAKAKNNYEMHDFVAYYEEYENRLKAMNAFDFDDLILATIDILLDDANGVRKRYTSQISHILVDEFQDINDLQFKLILLLMSPTTSLYVVGDPDQNIYTWRGANNNIILEFEDTLKKLYKGAKVDTIILNLNYRSTKTILDAANCLIQNNKLRFKKDLYANNGDGEAIVVQCEGDNLQEARFVSNTIKELHESGVEYRDIAVLYRNNYSSRALETTLNYQTIPYRIYGGLKFFQRKEIKDIMAYLTLLLNADADVAFSRIVNVPKRNIGQVSVDKLKRIASDNGISVLGLIHLSPDSLPLTPQKNQDLIKLESLLDEYRERIKEESLKQIPVSLEEMIERLGYIAELKQDKETFDEREENIKEFFGSMNRFFEISPTATFEEFMENCFLQSAQDEVEDLDTVSLMTVHTAKGLEFSYVFLYAFNDAIFPSHRSLLEQNGIEEERRLAYVAFTRAKKKLIVSCNEGYSYVHQQVLRPSCFIKEAHLVLKRAKTKADLGYYYKPSNGKSLFGALSQKVVPTTNKNNIKWAVGDKVKHDTFGEGEVLEVSPSLITIKFVNDKFGTKKLIASHYMLHKEGE